MSKKNIFINIALTTGSLLLIFFLLNMFFGRTAEKPEIRIQQVNFNDSINSINRNFAENNPHGFTDIPRTKKKKEGYFRIAVLGDSFIWGDGLYYEKVWSHKLEKMLLEKYDSIEVIHWGMNGWSTKNQLTFLDTAGMQYDFDLLILGWVNNDPDMGKFHHMNFNTRSTFSFLYWLFPSLADKVFSNIFRVSYQNWMNNLYSEKNLAEYEPLLDSLHSKATSKGAAFFAVLTPSCLHCEKEYKKIQPLFKKLNIDFIDVNDACLAQLSDYPPEALMANPENYHPGDLLTTVFADETFDYLQQNFSSKLTPKQQTQ